MQSETDIGTEAFHEFGDTRALLDATGERVEVELLAASDDEPDAVWLTLHGDEDDPCRTARLTPEQALRLGRWLSAAGVAALGD